MPRVVGAGGPRGAQPGPPRAEAQRPGQPRQNKSRVATLRPHN